MLARVSTREFARVGEPVGEQAEQAATSTNKSMVWEMFAETTRTALEERMTPALCDLRSVVMMREKLAIADPVHDVALGISTDGVRTLVRPVARLVREGDAPPFAAVRPR